MEVIIEGNYINPDNVTLAGYDNCVCGLIVQIFSSEPNLEPSDMAWSDPMKTAFRALEIHLDQAMLTEFVIQNNSNTGVSAGGANASAIWEATYLKNATARLNALSGKFNWTIADAYK